MAYLGDFGAAVNELDPSAEKDSFAFFGEKFEIIAELPAVLILQVGAFMTGKVDDTEGMGAMWSALDISLGEEEFARFYKLALTKRANVQSLMELVMSIFQASGGERPTVQAPDSLVGPPPTSQSSNLSASTPQDSGADRDPSVPHLVPVSQLVG